MEIPRDIINNLHYSRFQTATDRAIRDSAEKALGVFGPSAQKVLISRMYESLSLPVSDFMSNYSFLHKVLYEILGQGAEVIMNDIDRSIIQKMRLEGVLVDNSLEAYLEETKRKEILEKIGNPENRHLLHFSTSLKSREEILSAFLSDGSVAVNMPQSAFEKGQELRGPNLVSFLESNVEYISQGRPARIIGDATVLEEKIPAALIKIEEELSRVHIKYPTICLYNGSVCNTGAVATIISSHSEVIFDNPYTLYSAMN